MAYFVTHGQHLRRGDGRRDALRGVSLENLVLVGQLRSLSRPPSSADDGMLGVKNERAQKTCWRPNETPLSLCVRPRTGTPTLAYSTHTLVLK